MKQYCVLEEASIQVEATTKFTLHIALKGSILQKGDINIWVPEVLNASKLILI
jgi:hypothetical protein